MALVNPVDAPAFAEVTTPSFVEEVGGGGVEEESGMLNTFAYIRAASELNTLYSEQYVLKSIHGYFL
jgi:hypothetical protein